MILGMQQGTDVEAWTQLVYKPESTFEIGIQQVTGVEQWIKVANV